MEAQRGYDPEVEPKRRLGQRDVVASQCQLLIPPRF
jgi:hypothetical protein